MYSFGMTMWSIDAETFPFTDVKNIVALGTKVAGGARPPLNPKCKMNNIIQKCWDNVFFLLSVLLLCFLSIHN